VRQTDVAIVGAGFGGLGMAIRLKRETSEDFVLLERGDDVGGTWRANTYPGCQCDVPSNLYSFSFAPKPDWPQSYPMQDQILGYLRDCAQRFGVLPHTRFGSELLDASWRPERQRWELETSQGRLGARVLVVATGLLSEPRTPRVPGLESFEGTSFHTAAWDHGHDLRGKRVAVFGTGATAIQVVPSIRERVERLFVVQRTPPWVIPHFDRPVGPRRHALYARAPRLQKLARAGIWGVRETVVLGMAYDRRMLTPHEAAAKLQLRRQVRDPELRRRLTPDYSLGCKRVLLSSDWYPAITAPNVELVSPGVRQLRRHSMVSSDGREHQVDTLIFATGFSPSDPPIARRLHGSDGRALSEVWQGSPRAYLATTVAGFPNLFLLYGPNSNLGHSSIVYMLESQMEYALAALRTMRSRRAAAFEVRRESQDAYNLEIQRRLARSVWNSGCGSWYLDRQGRNSIMWPGFTFEFRRRTRRFDAGAYRFTPRLAVDDAAPLPA
jgi:cation diffusion facilitator CzcD-associated flavoprotein CzcO